MEWFKKFFTQKNIRRILFFVLPLVAQLIVFQYTDSSVPYILLGSYFPLLFSEGFAHDKSVRYYLMLFVNIAIRLLTFLIGITFVLSGKNLGPHNLTIGILFMILPLLSGLRMSYSLTGIMLLNSVGYFTMNADYRWFAIGFLLFFMIEFLTGTQLELLAPFSKQKFGLEYSNFNLSRGVLFTVSTFGLVLLAITVITMSSPFEDSYARQQKIYDQKVKKQEQIEEKNEEFFEKLLEISEDKKGK